MSLRFMILNADYKAFLATLHRDHPGLAAQPYDEQMRVRNESLFGVADFYSHNLRALGHEAIDVHANNEAMQRAWAVEHGLALRPEGARRWRLRRRGGVVPWVDRAEDRRWMYDVLEAQIRHFRPDVVINQALDAIDARFLAAMRPHYGLLAGQVAAPLGDERGLKGYDVILSSLPNFVERFRAMGVASELHRFAFDERVLDAVGAAERSIDLSFVGSISWHHRSRRELLETLAARLPLELWGQWIGAAEPDAPLVRRHHGEAWGRRMYEILRASRITLNHHIGISEGYANNMRLFEATGMGALLVTDHKENLHEMFEPGTEVVVYRSHEECAEVIAHYLAHEGERAAIAAAGQRRTLRDHTYRLRMAELADLLAGYHARRAQRGGAA